MLLVEMCLCVRILLLCGLQFADPWSENKVLLVFQLLRKVVKLHY